MIKRQERFGKNLNSNVNKQIVFLIHGFNGNAREMEFLQEKLKSEGFIAITIDLPATFQNLQTCTDILVQKINTILDKNGWRFDKVQLNFVGHSFGGLIIRNFWSQNYIYNPGRNVLIATPNRGTRLADIISKIPFYTDLFKPVQDLKTPGPQIGGQQNLTTPEFGVIAGTKCNNPLSRYILKESNDGRVPVSSAKLYQLTDMIELELTHKQIHRSEITVDLIVNFIKKARFSF